MRRSMVHLHSVGAGGGKWCLRPEVHLVFVVLMKAILIGRIPL